MTQTPLGNLKGWGGKYTVPTKNNVTLMSQMIDFKEKNVEGGCYRKPRWGALELLRTEGKERPGRKHNWNMATAASDGAEKQRRVGHHHAMTPCMSA